MTNAEMFVYVYGILIKRGTAHAWNELNQIQDPVANEWLVSTYTVEAMPGMNLNKLITDFCKEKE